MQAWRTVSCARCTCDPLRPVLFIPELLQLRGRSVTTGSLLTSLLQAINKK